MQNINNRREPIKSLSGQSSHRLISLCIVVFVLVSASWAGNRDAHLTATHYIARYVGFSEKDAEVIASADWSMDLNKSTTSSPLSPGWLGYVGWAQDYVQDPTASQARERSGHMFSENRERVLTQLSALKADVEDAAGRDRESALRMLGVYMHALQDSYFHQQDGQPFTPPSGQFPADVQGWDTDSVYRHADRAQAAFMATDLTLRAFLETHRLPDPKDLHIYDVGSSALNQASRDAVAIAGLTANISEAYDLSRPLTRRIHGEDVTGYLSEPDLQVLDMTLRKLWNRQHKESGNFTPILKLQNEDVERFPRAGAGEAKLTDFDNKPTWLPPTLYFELHPEAKLARTRIVEARTATHHDGPSALGQFARGTGKVASTTLKIAVFTAFMPLRILAAGAKCSGDCDREPYTPRDNASDDDKSSSSNSQNSTANSDGGTHSATRQDSNVSGREGDAMRQAQTATTPSGADKVFDGKKPQ
jgi:hypothetical protein